MYEAITKMKMKRAKVDLQIKSTEETKSIIKLLQFYLAKNTAR